MHNGVLGALEPGSGNRWLKELTFRLLVAAERLVIVSTLLVVIAASPTWASPLFPPDSGIIDVRRFGAVGDGIADDTQAILRAISQIPVYVKQHPIQPRIVYFPEGTYRVSDTIVRRDAEGLFQPNLVLIGESRQGTIIKLPDGASGYGDASHPKAVIYTTSGLKFNNDPRDGGKDYLNKGEGNEAFTNTIENLTVDVGRDNPGAIGIDYLANNEGVVRNVTIEAHGAAYVGLSMIRCWPGPGMISNVSIAGFDIGVDIAWTELSMTFDKIRISGSRQYGLRNRSNIVSFHDLEIVTEGGYGIANVSPDGLIVGIGGRISGRGTGPLQNSGAINFKDVLAQKYRATDGGVTDAPLDGVYQGTERLSDAAWKLPILSPPEPDPIEAAEWVNIARYGAVADPKVNSTAAFAAAFKSDARVVYIPTGEYFVDAPIAVADNIERIEGMFSIIGTGWGYHSSNSQTPKSLFITSPSRQKTLFIRRLTVEKKYGNVFAVVDHHSSATLVMSDISAFAMVNRFPEGGRVFGENIAAGYIYLAGGAGVWLRQVDTEGHGVRMPNNGSPLWILGIKTEQTNTLIQNMNGGEAEVVGGLIYRVFGTEPQMPLFVNVDARLEASYAEEAFRPDAFYAVHLESYMRGGHRIVRAEELPKRGSIARMVPNLSTDDRPQ
jgi:hypothetical protein